MNGDSKRTRGWKFPFGIDKKTGRIMASEDDDDIRESIEIILFTERGERVERPDFGTALNQFMFETIDAGLLYRMKKEIVRSLEYWEPRIHNLDVSVELNPADRSKILIQIEYQTDSLSHTNYQSYGFETNKGIYL